MGHLTGLRDEVYTRIGLKQALTQFSINGFFLQKTWRPKEDLETLKQREFGKLYVLSGVPSPTGIRSRSGMVLKELPVSLGYQRYIENYEDIPLIDDCINLIEELDDMLRHELTETYSFNRLEYATDENGVPYSFTMLREASTFECIFSAYFNLVAP